MPPELPLIPPVPTATLPHPHAEDFPQSHGWLLFHDSKGAKDMSMDREVPSRAVKGVLGWKVVILSTPHDSTHAVLCTSHNTGRKSFCGLLFFVFRRCLSPLFLKAHELLLTTVLQIWFLKPCYNGREISHLEGKTGLVSALCCEKLNSRQWTCNAE